MKKYILFLLLFISTISYSQTRIGYSRKAIKEEFYGYKMKSGINANGVPYLEVTLVGITAVYGFDDNAVCMSCVIIPHDNANLNTLVQKYNRDYIIISPIEWMMYSSGGILRIQMKMVDSGGAYFLWTRY